MVWGICGIANHSAEFAFREVNASKTLSNVEPNWCVVLEYFSQEPLRYRWALGVWRVSMITRRIQLITHLLFDQRTQDGRPLECLWAADDAVGRGC
jgi:hypothetical protein